MPANLKPPMIPVLQNFIWKQADVCAAHGDKRSPHMKHSKWCMGVAKRTVMVRRNSKNQELL
jgi:hypothetical protein